MPDNLVVDGSRVVLDRYHGDHSINALRLVGTFRNIRGRTLFESDEPHSALHDCNGLVTRGRGWFVKSTEVSLVEQVPYECSRPKSGFGRFVSKQEKVDVEYYERLRIALAKRQTKEDEKARKKEERCLKKSTSKKSQTQTQDSPAISM